jgi:hypothetical protein
VARLATHLTRAGYREEGRLGSFVAYWHLHRERPPLDVMLVDEMTFAKLFAESIPYEFGEVTFTRSCFASSCCTQTACNEKRAGARVQRFRRHRRTSELQST